MANCGSFPSASQVRQEVMSFRVAELGLVAERLGLKKTGRKGELQGRILAYFGELDPNSAAAAALGRSTVRGPQQQWKIEQAAKLVHEVYCKMRGLPATAPSDQSAHSSLPVPAGGGVGSGAAAATHQEMHASMLRQEQRLYDYGQRQRYGGAGLLPLDMQSEAAALAALQQQGFEVQPAALAGYLAPDGSGSKPRRVRCICHVQSERGRMVQCEGKGCGIWQHCDCLGIDRLSDSIKGFLCELCRARLADPFWEVTEQVLPPSRLRSQEGRPPLLTASGMQEVQCGDRVFYLNQQQLESVQRDPENHRVQVGCLLVGDEVVQRYHWPKHVDLKINNLPHRPYGRAFNATMGINQRDDVANIGMMVVRGRNSLGLTAAEGGTWIITVQLARRRTLEQVKGLMAPPESLQYAVARVRRQVGGGGDGGENSDDDLLVSHQVVSLKDPMSGQRIQVPGRFIDASGLQAFDLDSFLSMTQRNRKWQDPTTMQNSSVEQLQVDTYIQHVLQCLKRAPNVTDIEVSAEGQWRPEGSSCEWMDVSADPVDVAAKLATPRPLSGGIKPEPEAAAGNGGSAANGGAGGGKDEGFLVADSDSSDEEEDEAEELRKAAAAVRRSSSAALATLSAQKRKAEAEVIDLLSSDDEEAPSSRPQQQQQHAAPPAGNRPAGSAPQEQRRSQQPGLAQQPAQRQQHPAQQQQQQPRQPPLHPLRIRLPVRPRASGQQPPGVVPAARHPPASDAALQRSSAQGVPQQVQAGAPPLYQQALLQQQHPQQQAGPGAAPVQSVGMLVSMPLPHGVMPAGSMFITTVPGAAAYPGFMPAGQMLMAGSQQLQAVMSGSPLAAQQQLQGAINAWGTQMQQQYMPQQQWPPRQQPQPQVQTQEAALQQQGHEQPHGQQQQQQNCHQQQEQPQQARGQEQGQGEGEGRVQADPYYLDMGYPPFWTSDAELADLLDAGF